MIKNILYSIVILSPFVFYYFRITDYHFNAFDPETWQGWAGLFLYVLFVLSLVGIVWV